MGITFINIFKSHYNDHKDYRKLTPRLTVGLLFNLWKLFAVLCGL